MTGVLRPMTAADHHDVLDLNERHVELLSPLDEDRLVAPAGWSARAARASAP